MSQPSTFDGCKAFSGLMPGAKRHKAALRLWLLWFGLLYRPASVAPRGEAAPHMRDRLQPHVLCGFRRQHRTHAAGAMEDEFLFLLEYRLGVRARRIDPEFQHAARARERAGNSAVALDLAGIADVDDDDVIVVGDIDRVCGAYCFDFGIGLVDQRLDATMNGLGH